MPRTRTRRQIVRYEKLKKGRKIQNQQIEVSRGERENIARMIPPNTNPKPDEPVPPKPALDATTTISPPALMQQKVSPKGGMQLPPIPPLPEHLKNADTETKLLYFREAKRVLIEKCRENRCGNDEVTRETHGLGEFTSGWKGLDYASARRRNSRTISSSFTSNEASLITKTCGSTSSFVHV